MACKSLRLIALQVSGKEAPSVEVQWVTKSKAYEIDPSHPSSLLGIGRLLRLPA